MNISAFKPIVFKDNRGKNLIYDLIRKKYIHLTKEEWVRQYWITNLLQVFLVPKSMISVEKKIKKTKNNMRYDIVTYTKIGKPLLLIECKSFHIKLKEEHVAQLQDYNNLIKAPFLVLSNGLENFMWQFCKDQYKNISNLDISSFYEINK